MTSPSVECLRTYVAHGKHVELLMAHALRLERELAEAHAELARVRERVGVLELLADTVADCEVDE